MKLWRNRTLASPLALVGLAVICVQFAAWPAGINHTFRRVPPLLCSRTFVLGILCFEVLVDLLLLAWVARAITRGSGFVRVTGLFYLWQGVKVSFAFFCVAFAYGYFPFPPWL